MDLARHYRPKRFDEIKGQSGVPELQQLVRQSADAETLTSRLFLGPPGTGKTSTARVLAAALNCESSDDGEPCGRCRWCKDIFSRHSFALLEYDAGLYGGVDTIRKLRDVLSYKAACDWQIVLLDEVHSMSSDAFDALLKPVEEPPSGTLFVLITTDLSKIPDAMVSRCLLTEFSILDEGVIAQRLGEVVSREQLAVDKDAVLAIAKACQGRMRDALNHLERVALGAAVPLRPQPVAVDVARELRRLSKLLAHDMSPAQFKVAKYLVDIAITTESAEVTYPKKQLKRDAGVAIGTVKSALAWMVSQGHLVELDPAPGTESSRWKLLIGGG